MLKPEISRTSVRGIFRAQPPLSTLPRTAVTGASADRRSRIAGSPMSPAWIMCSEPRSASRASGRTRPWVSEMTPMVDTAILFAKGARDRHSLDQHNGMGDGSVVGSHAFRSLGLEANSIRGNAKQDGHTFANLRRVRSDFRGRKYQRRIDA